ncbi:MAG: branched-chain amino acid ABC transporter permease [Acidimicrobiales bacterium]
MALVVQQGSSQHRNLKIAGYGLLTVVLLIAPIILPEFQVGRLNRAIAIATAVLGLNLVVGFSGLLALCQSAFIAIGAFVCATLVHESNWDYWMTVPFAMFAAFLFGLLLGVPALRIKGLYLAMATVAFAAAFPSLTKLELFGIARRTGGANGLKINEAIVPTSVAEGLGFSVDKPFQYRYYWILLLAVLCFVGVANLLKSRPGRAVVAIRDNETGAAVSGVDIRRVKVINFGLSAAIGGLAGVMYAMNTGFVAETSFTFVLMVDLLVALVIGGVATIQGPIFGALVVVFVREFTKNISIPLGFYTLDGDGPLSQAIFGIILIAVVFFAPHGIAGFVKKYSPRFVQVIPTPPTGGATATTARTSAADLEVAAQ